MKDYVLRMIEERKQLEERIEKLRRFLDEKDTEITKCEENLMLAQRRVMEAYDLILAERIAIEAE